MLGEVPQFLKPDALSREPEARVDAARIGKRKHCAAPIFLLFGARVIACGNFLEIPTDANSDKGDPHNLVAILPC